MTSEKKSEILKIGIFISIVICSFLLFPKLVEAWCAPSVIYRDVSGYCTDYHATGECRAEGTCNCPAGAGPCGCGVQFNFNYSDVGCLATGPKGCEPVGECCTWVKHAKFPDTNNYNGNRCVIKSSCGLGCCDNGEGVWDASEKKCVQCDGNFEKKICGDTTTLYLGCSQQTATTCEAACPSYSGSLKCDDKTPASESNPGDPCGAGGHCDANCQCIGEAPPCSWQNDGCGLGCDARAMHQTCGPPGCSGGDCKADETRCVPNHPSCIPCEENCTCPCPKVCECPLGDCVGEYEKLKGGLVPCGRMCNDPCTKECECCPCTLCHLFVLFKKIVDFLTINIIFPLAVLMIVIGGVMFLTAAGSPERINTAKKILTSTVIGLVIIFLAWLIVDTTIGVLVRTDNPFGMVLRNWSDIPCPICGDGVCESKYGETSENCPADCGPPPTPICSNLSCQGSETNCQCGTAQTTAANPWCCAASNSVYASQANCQADPACANPCGCLCTDCPGVVSPCP